MRGVLLGVTGHGAVLALSLVVLGCGKPLATLDVAEPAAGRPALERSEAELSAARSLRIVAVAKRYLGSRYVWGGSSPAGFDCSGFVMYVYSHVGVSLPHNAAKQYRYGAPVTRGRLEPGDVVFFDDLHHTGIYVGDGRFIHARRSGRGVIVSGLDESWYRTRWVGGRRL
jgi:cell wall-associated NlpC family hydrolase